MLFLFRYLIRQFYSLLGTLLQSLEFNFHLVFPAPVLLLVVWTKLLGYGPQLGLKGELKKLI